MKEDIEALIKNSANDLKTSTRVVVEQLLAQFEIQLLFETISNYMNNSSIERREWIICVRTLCQIDKNEANKRFEKALQVNDADKRFRIVKLLSGECGTEHIVPTLITMLKQDPEPGIRFIVAYALGMISDKRAISALEWSAANDHELNHEEQSISSQAEKSIKIIQNNQIT